MYLCSPMSSHIRCLAKFVNSTGAKYLRPVDSQSTMLQKLLEPLSSMSLNTNMLVVVVGRLIHDFLDASYRSLFSAIIGIQSIDFLFNVTPINY